MKPKNISSITLGQYMAGADELITRFVQWLSAQGIWLTQEQIAKRSSVPPARLAIALKLSEHDPRIALYRKDGCTWYRATTNLPIKTPVTG